MMPSPPHLYIHMNVVKIPVRHIDVTSSLILPAAWSSLVFLLMDPMTLQESPRAADAVDKESSPFPPRFLLPCSFVGTHLSHDSSPDLRACIVGAARRLCLSFSSPPLPSTIQPCCWPLQQQKSSSSNRGNAVFILGSLHNLRRGRLHRHQSSMPYQFWMVASYLQRCNIQTCIVVVMR